jgi:pilus assembly protein CpaE
MAAEMAPMLSHGLPLAPIHDVNSYPDRREILQLIKSVDPKVCFLDFSSDEQAASAVAGDIRIANATMPIVALLGGNNPDLILRCLRQGASDFLIRPFSIDQIDAAVEKIARQQPAPARRSVSGGKLLAVIPAKGACGATTIACSLAHQSKKVSKKILLADLDPLTGTVSFLLKLKSSYSFLDVLNRQATLDTDLWKQLVTTSQGIDVLLAPENLMEGLDDLRDASPIVDYAQTNYETAIIDCGSAYGEWNLSVARQADEVLLVTMNDLASLQAAQRVLAYFEQNRVEPGKIRLILNRYEPDLGLTSNLIGQALQTEVFQVIPADNEAVQKSLMEGKPIASGSVFGKNVASILQRIGSKSKSDGNDNQKKNKPISGLLGMFSRASS